MMGLVVFNGKTSSWQVGVELHSPYPTKEAFQTSCRTGTQIAGKWFPQLTIQTKSVTFITQQKRSTFNKLTKWYVIYSCYPIWKYITKLTLSS